MMSSTSAGCEDALDTHKPHQIKPRRHVIVREFPDTLVLMPVVRACEKLHPLEQSPTAEDIQTAACVAVADYYMCRLMFEVRVRSKVDMQT